MHISVYISCRSFWLTSADRASHYSFVAHITAPEARGASTDRLHLRSAIVRVPAVAVDVSALTLDVAATCGESVSKIWWPAGRSSRFRLAVSTVSTSTSRRGRSVALDSSNRDPRSSATSIETGSILEPWSKNPFRGRKQTRGHDGSVQQEVRYMTFHRQDFLKASAALRVISTASIHIHSNTRSSRRN